MGYTHYWDIPKEVKQEDYEKALEVIQKLVKKLPKHSTSAGGYYKKEPLELFGRYGTGDAVFSSECISFNGNYVGDLGHETFYFAPNEKIGFSFCKTARKPYDFMVCLCLLALKDNIPGFKYSSDGNADDWKEVKKFYKIYK